MYELLTDILAFFITLIIFIPVASVAVCLMTFICVIVEEIVVPNFFGLF